MGNGASAAAKTWASSSFINSYIIGIASRTISNKLLTASGSSSPAPAVPTKKQSQAELNEDSIVSFGMKLLFMRELLMDDNYQFKMLIYAHYNKEFLEKYNLLQEIQRKIFCRMLLADDPDEYHQLDDLVSLQEFLALDSSFSAPIHMVCEKLRKFVCNYQTSYERWLEILSSLQDELLMQLIGDYDEYVDMTVNK